MKVSTWLYCVITGRLAHWSDINDQLVADVWPTIEAMNPETNELWRNALISSLGMMEKMLGPERGKKGILGIDLKAVTREKASLLYAELLGAFMNESLRISPKLERTLTVEYERIAKKLRVPSRQLLAPFAPIEVVANSLWERIVSLSGSDRKMDFNATFEFVTMFMAHATHNLSNA